MRLLGTFVVLLAVGSGALTVAWESLAQAGDGRVTDSVAGLAGGAIASISLILLGRIVYRVSRPTRPEGL
ncbi:MAG: hypothetical protein L6Q80_06830 [Dehalococcoidia bacterium]|nr:hypothetical protein [Dehalococcoidia bacterium]